MNRVYFLLGSNIDPLSNILQARNLLSNISGVSVRQESSLWQTKSFGYAAEDFLNMAVSVDTTMDIKTIKESIIGSIENRLKRVRLPDKFAPRTIDIDIVVFNDQILERDVFELEHMILPFAELLPDLAPEENLETLKDIALRIQPCSTSKRVANLQDT